MNTQEIYKMSVLGMYRYLLKNMRYYPSVNRYNILVGIKQEFRENKNEKDEKAIEIGLRKARILVGHVQYYKRKSEELRDNYTLKDEFFRETLNPKDDGFIYF